MPLLVVPHIYHGAPSVQNALARGIWLITSISGTPCAYNGGGVADALEASHHSLGEKPWCHARRFCHVSWEAQHQIGTEDKLSALQNKIEEANLGFDAKLVDTYSTLTKAEREVCALLRINLSMKEVASIRNTSVESVKSIRYRLRKKMGIPKHTELELYIQSLWN